MPYTNRIILHTLRTDATADTVYGMIYYDIERDAVFFQNSAGVDSQLSQPARGSWGGSVSVPSGAAFRPIYRGAWADNMHYAHNDMVHVDTSVYLALKKNSHCAPAHDKVHWALMFDLSAILDLTPARGLVGAPGKPGTDAVSPNPCGRWLAETRYNPGDIVSIDCILYWAHSANTDCNPKYNPLAWRLFLDLTDMIKTSSASELSVSCNSASVSYSEDSDYDCNVGGIDVNYHRHQHRHITANDAKHLPTPKHYLFDSQPDAMDTIDNWLPDVAYHTNNFVMLDGDIYRCKQAHTSAPGNRPALSEALWAIEALYSSGPRGASVCLPPALSHGDEHRHESHVYLLLCRSSDDIEIDIVTGCSRRLTTIHDHGQSNTCDDYGGKDSDPIAVTVTRDASTEFSLVNCFKYISAINRNYYDVSTGAGIKILKTGWYNVNYNINYKSDISDSSSRLLLRAVVFTTTLGGKATENELLTSATTGETSQATGHMVHSLTKLFPVKLDRGCFVQVRLQPVLKSAPRASDRVTKTREKLQVYPFQSWIHIARIN